MGLVPTSAHECAFAFIAIFCMTYIVRFTLYSATHQSVPGYAYLFIRLHLKEQPYTEGVRLIDYQMKSYPRCFVLTCLFQCTEFIKFAFCFFFRSKYLEYLTFSIRLSLDIIVNIRNFRLNK